MSQQTMPTSPERDLHWVGLWVAFPEWCLQRLQTAVVTKHLREDIVDMVVPKMLVDVVQADGTVTQQLRRVADNYLYVRMRWVPRAVAAVLGTSGIYGFVSSGGIIRPKVVETRGSFLAFLSSDGIWLNEGEMARFLQTVATSEAVVQAAAQRSA